MLIVPEREIADLMTRKAAFDAVEQVFAAMASGDAYNFPVVREAIGHENASVSTPFCKKVTKLQALFVLK